MSNIGENIKFIRLKKGLTQQEFAKLLNVDSSSAISNWEKGKREPDLITLKKIAQLGNVSVDWILNYDSKETQIAELALEAQTNPINSNRGSARDQLNQLLKEKRIEKQFANIVNLHDYPVLTTVYAGEPEMLMEPDQFEEYQAFTYYKKGHHCFAVKVQGDSMETTLKDGDVVLCDLDAQLTNNCLVAVRLKNGNQYIKRYKEINNDFIHLSSDNGSYGDRIIAKEDVEVIARVVEGIVKF